MPKLPAINLIPQEIKNKYNIENNAFIRNVVKNPILDVYKGEPKDEVKITLGDKDKTEFIPDIELKRWNEVSFKIKPRLSDVLSKDKSLSFEGEKVKFNTPKISFEMYDYTEGEGDFKFVWYLNEKPTSNKVELDIEISGLDFFFQPPLTQEYQNGYSKEFDKEIIVTETQIKDLEGKVLMERPENVVGSYAVYHQTKGGMNDINGKEYKVGKAFHIYRPKLIDAKGKETWGILKIENGIYSVEIPQEFLDKAVYPVRSNDTFGYTTKGSSAYKLWDFDSTYGTPTNNGTVTSITAYLRNEQSAAINTNFGFYQDKGDGIHIGTHIAHGTAESIPVAFDNWKTINVNGQVEYGIKYWVAIQQPGGTDLTDYYDSGTSNQEIFVQDFDWDTWLDNSPNVDGKSFKPSIYATYTAGGATEYTATCTETLTTSDTTTKLQGLSKTFFDIFIPSDIILKSQGMVKTLSEILTPTEITISNVYQGIKTFVEDVVMSDIISVGRKFSVVLSDIIYIEKKVFEEFTATLSEIITTTDATISKTWNSFKTLTETLILSDTLTKASSFIKSLTETITISDILSKIEISILTLSENIGLTDVISKTTFWVKSLTETITPSDVFSKITAFGKTLSEIITATEDWIITEINAFVITLTETLNFSDTLSKIRGIYKTFSETLNLTDTLTRTSNWIKTFTETFTLSDIFSSVKVGLLNLSETIGLTDTLSKLTTWAKTFSESTTISDSLSKVYGKLLILIETITLSDTITTIEKKILNLIETLNISDTLSKLAKWAKSLTEIAIISDIITIGGNWWNGITKNISSWTHGTKHTSTWTEDTKHSSNWKHQNKSN